MSQTETLAAEAGDDRNKEIEIAKLEEMYEKSPEITIPGPGDILINQSGKFGHLLLRKAHITILN
jgi:hypothetical protein